MKKLIFTIAFAASVFMLQAKTYEENLALSRTLLDKITSSNVYEVCNACLVVSNLTKIIACEKNGLISFEKTQELILSNDPIIFNFYIDNAIYSSNDMIKATCFNTCVSNAYEKGNKESVELLMIIYRSINPELFNAKDMLNIAKEITKISGIYVSQSFLYSYALYARKNIDEDSIAFISYADQMLDAAIQSYIDNNFFYWSNGKINWVCNGYYLFYYIVNKYGFNSLKINKMSSKICQLISEYGYIGCVDGNSTIIKEIRHATISSSKVSIDKKILATKIEDKYAKNFDATTSLWPQLTNDYDKVSVALYLKDVDKLIDSLKAAGDKLDAKTINATIAPLNNINAGYRTDDLKLALMNINKKYTLKLYDDRDTWEPILSKIRAMIDAIQ